MVAIKKTREYDKFKFREDNRESINQSHVKRLADSIKARNLLELRPISVNADMEVIDGQHRLLAAKMLGTEIYYTQNNALQASDIILMNVSRSWGQSDYLNYYCKNNYPEYIKLKDFMKKNNLNIKIALNITMGQSRQDYFNFKDGSYIFNEENFDKHIDIVWDTIEYIKRMNGASYYTETGKFWGAMLIMIRHTNFDPIRWRENLKRMVERFTAKISREDYLKLLMDVHNWHNKAKVDLLEE